MGDVAYEQFIERRLETFVHCCECVWVGKVRQLHSQKQNFYCPTCASQRRVASAPGYQSIATTTEEATGRS